MPVSPEFDRRREKFVAGLGLAAIALLGVAGVVQVELNANDFRVDEELSAGFSTGERTLSWETPEGVSASTSRESGLVSVGSKAKGEIEPVALDSQRTDIVFRLSSMRAAGGKIYHDLDTVATYKFVFGMLKDPFSSLPGREIYKHEGFYPYPLGLWEYFDFLAQKDLLPDDRKEKEIMEIASSRPFELGEEFRDFIEQYLPNNSGMLGMPISEVVFDEENFRIRQFFTNGVVAKDPESGEIYFEDLGAKYALDNLDCTEFGDGLVVSQVDYAEAKWREYLLMTEGGDINSLDRATLKKVAVDMGLTSFSELPDHVWHRYFEFLNGLQGPELDNFFETLGIYQEEIDGFMEAYLSPHDFIGGRFHDYEMNRRDRWIILDGPSYGGGWSGNSGNLVNDISFEDLPVIYGPYGQITPEEGEFLKALFAAGHEAFHSTWQLTSECNPLSAEGYDFQPPHRLMNLPIHFAIEGIAWKTGDLTQFYTAEDGNEPDAASVYYAFKLRERGYDWMNFVANGAVHGVDYCFPGEQITIEEMWDQNVAQEGAPSFRELFSTHSLEVKKRTDFDYQEALEVLRGDYFQKRACWENLSIVTTDNTLASAEIISTTEPILVDGNRVVYERRSYLDGQLTNTVFLYFLEGFTNEERDCCLRSFERLLKSADNIFGSEYVVFRTDVLIIIASQDVNGANDYGFIKLKEPGYLSLEAGHLLLFPRTQYSGWGEGVIEFLKASSEGEWNDGSSVHSAMINYDGYNQRGLLEKDWFSGPNGSPNPFYYRLAGEAVASLQRENPLFLKELNEAYLRGLDDGIYSSEKRLSIKEFEDLVEDVWPGGWEKVSGHYALFMTY